MKICDIQKLTDEDLAELLRKSEFNSLDREHATTEIQRRLLTQMKTPHWSTTPNFWATIIAAVAAVAALVVQLWQPQAPQLAKTEPPSLSTPAKTETVEGPIRQ